MKLLLIQEGFSAWKESVTVEVDVGGEEIRMSVMGSRERVPVQSKQLMAAPGKLLSTPLSKQNGSRGSQPQWTSSAKETLGLGCIFYFYLLSQHRL